MANMLYNGVELPDINTVWTDKTTYPYACVLYVAGGGAELGVPNGDLANLQLFDVRGSVADGSLLVKSPFRYKNYVWTNSQEIVDIFAGIGVTAQVNAWFLIEDYTSHSDTLHATPTWSSYDILNEDGSVYLAASDPVPVGTSTYDRTAFLSGMAMGLCGKGNPTFEGSGKMLYNGVELPDISNVWDKKTHPYACSYTSSSGSWLYLTSVPVVYKHGDSYGYVRASSVPYSWQRYRLTDGVFRLEISEENDEYSTLLWGAYWDDPTRHIAWTSYDILLEGEETVFLAASGPVPVEDTFSKGYLVGAALRRKRVLPQWETLWDDKSIDGSVVGYNGHLQWLWDDSSENLLSAGDLVRVTVDGISSTLTVSNMPTGTGWVEAGNKWLYANSATDDGTDIYFTEYKGSLRLFTRKKYYTEMPHVKFERAIKPVPVYE